MSYALDSSPRPLDSPSRQLLLDLARDFEQFHIYASDIKRAKVYERRSFYDDLDRIDRERAAEHNAALDKVAANRARVREEAEETLRKHLIAEEELRVRREEEARQERERFERERAEKLRREQEEAARKEAERKAKEEARKKAEAETERARKAEEEDRKRREHDEHRKRVEEEQKAEQETAQRKAQAAQAARQKQVGGGRQTEEETRIHLRYVELHQQLKKFRQWLREEGKSNPTVKQSTGDIRRSIKKCVGQLRDGKGANKQQVSCCILPDQIRQLTLHTAPRDQIHPRQGRLCIRALRRHPPLPRLPTGAYHLLKRHQSPRPLDLRLQHLRQVHHLRPHHRSLPAPRPRRTNRYRRCPHLLRRLLHLQRPPALRHPLGQVSCRLPCPLGLLWR